MIRRLIAALGALIALLLSAPGYTAGTQAVHPLYLEEDRWNDYVYCSLRDNDGYLWIGTENGLKRYDGYNIRVFKRDPKKRGSIETRLVRHLLVSSEGVLWAAGATLSRYHPETETFTNYPFNNNRQIRTVYEDDQGFFWLGGEGFGLLKFDPQTEKVQQSFFTSDPKGLIWKILPHADTGKIWLATVGGLFLFDTQTHELENFPLPLDFSIGFEVIRGMVEDDEGNLWLATNLGLFTLHVKTKVLKHYLADFQNPKALATNFVTSVAKDSEGNIWIGTDKNGAHRYFPETGEFEHYASSGFDAYKFPMDSVSHIQEDEEGTLWFSVGHYGVYRLSPHLEKFKSFKHSFDSNNSLSLDNVLDIHEDRHGYIWIGTDGGGLNRFNPRTNDFEHFRHDPDNPESIGNDTVLAIAEDSKGILWLGTWGGGISRFDPTTRNFQTIKRDPNASTGNSLADNNIFRILVDKEDRLLLSVWGMGLQIYDPKNGTYDSYLQINDVQKSGIRSAAINAITPTPEGEYWIGGYHGLELFSPQTQRFSAPDLAITEPIFDIHLDNSGILWIATNKNLVRYKPGVNLTEFYGVKNGISNEQIVSIEEDELGFLWLGTRKGLNRFDPRSKEVIVFDEYDGLASSQFNRFSHLKTRDGRMYFGGTTGFSYFDPTNLPRNEHAPQIHITSMEINQQTQEYGRSKWLPKAIDYVETLKLPYDQRDISFTFTATNFISPTKNTFRYRLKGLEEEWFIGDSSRRRVRYNNLEPGEYQFQILASNNEGVWVGSAKELNVIIFPPWWQTWWARAIYFISIIIAMYLFSYWRLRSNRRREKQLEILIGEQTSKLKAANRSIIHLNTELEQRVAHRTKELSIEIEERRESEAKANHIAYHDALTGLYNRAWLLTHLEELIKFSPADHPGFALFFVGGDRFRKINDTYGHLHGDLLLVAAAKRLVSILAEEYHAVRLGSDEFTVVIDSIESQEQVTALAERITDSFKEHFLIEQVRMNLSVSVGYVISDKGYTEPSQVLRNANVAMQRAKDRGRGIAQMFDKEILQDTLNNAALEADLKLALVRKQFSVVYQPIMIVGSGAITGFEILLRWKHPERGMVPPDKFIPMAESLGLIFDIGLWVLEKACEQLQIWQRELNLPILPSIAVNLSPVQLEHVDLLDRLDAVLKNTGVSQEHITFEITESALMKHTDTVDGVLEALRERGIELAIDDFGTGYSSLSYLDKLPVQVLKIDRSFVNALTDVKSKTGSAHEIVRATISLAHNLKMRVVAEGIETREQLEALKAYDCDYGQGYFIARPLSPEDATRFLANAKVDFLQDLSLLKTDD